MADTGEMSRADLEAFVRRHQATQARHDATALAADHHEEGVIESPMFATLQGRPAIEESYRTLYTSFPDWTLTTQAVLIDPPHVAIFTTVNATHVGDFFGLPGTNRKVEFQAVRCLTFKDGLIARERRIYDFTGFLVQVGVLRAKPAKP
jgi:steroid delta-isomerase-like uncharacterized protein